MMNIASAADTRYIQHCTVMLASLVEHTPPDRFQFFLLADTDAPEVLGKLRRFCERKGIRLTVFDVRDMFPEVKELKTVGHLTRTVWFRLCLPALLPGEHKLLYLDADVIFLKPVRELYETDISRHSAAAVPDSMGPECYRPLGLDTASDYFNSGVLLMNLDYFREHHIAGKCIAFAREHPELLRFADQCALNHVLKGTVRTLDHRWNFHPKWREQPILSGLWKSRRAPAATPGLVHFVGSFKPWLYLAQLEYGDEYWRLLATTEFADYVPPDLTTWNQIKKSLKRFLPKPLREWARGTT